MKRIEFIAPVEAMRGNLSGSQKLQYAKNNNPAWDAPEGEQAARNYTPRYVGAKRSKDGLKYFGVRKSSVTKISVKSREIMALLAGSSACYLAASKNLQLFDVIYAAFDAAKASDASLTFRKWLQGILYEMLANKQGYTEVTAVVGGTSISKKIGNPWVAPGAGVTGVIALTIPQSTLVKFWTQLSDGGFNFTLVAAGGNRAKGIAFANEPWETLVENAQQNVLGLTIEEGVLRYKGLVVYESDGDTPVDTADNIAPIAYPVGK